MYEKNNLNNKKEPYGHIYKIINLVNDKCYIGQTTNLNERTYKHFHNLRLNNHENQHLQNSFNEYGENNFKIDIIDSADSQDELNKLEKIYIIQAGYPNQELCYNLKEGGDSMKFPLEIKQKISQAHIGLKLSEEQCFKLSSVNNLPYRVRKEKDSRQIQGFHYRYEYKENNQKRAICSVNIYELKEKVKSKSLPWNWFDYIPNENEIKKNKNNKLISYQKRSAKNNFPHRVSKVKTKNCKQGFTYRYGYTDENNQNRQIANINIYKLFKQVKNKNLPWNWLNFNYDKKVLYGILIEEDEKIHELDLKTLNIYKRVSSHNNFPFRVHKKTEKSCTQGFRYVYNYKINQKRKSITSTDLNKLHDKVIDKGLPWDWLNYNPNNINL